MIEFLTEKGIGNAKVNYKLRDWVFSVRDTGASLFQLFIVTNVAMFQLMRANFHYFFQR